MRPLQFRAHQCCGQSSVLNVLAEVLGMVVEDNSPGPPVPLTNVAGGILVQIIVMRLMRRTRRALCHLLRTSLT
jgi:hypothetical protein